LNQGQSLGVAWIFIKGWDKAKRLNNMISEIMGFHLALFTTFFVEAHACL